MGQNLTKFLGGLIAPKAVSDILDNQDPKSLGAEAGKGLKTLVINQIGEKPYKAMRPKFIAWVDAFYVALRKALNVDTN